MSKLTKRFIDSVTPNPQKEVVHWDEAMPCFGLRVRPSGAKSYIVQYRTHDRRTRKMTIGRVGRLTPDQARIQAREALAEVDKNGDPMAERKAARNMISVGELSDRYMREHAHVKKKATSAAKDQQWISRFIVPAFGRRKLNAVTRADVQRLHYGMRATPYQANRTLETLRAMFNMAEAWGILPDGSNPCRRVQKYKEAKRERYLTPEEMARLGTTLAKVEKEGLELPGVVTCIRLLLLTGARRGEVLGLRWEWVDFEGACLRLPDSKTGAKTIPLNEPALKALADTPRIEGKDYVCPGTRPNAPLVGIYRPWARICERAKIDGLRLHDLRHSYASIAAGAGLGLPVIGALLGHTQASTTQRYAHLAQDPLRAAAEDIGKRIAEALAKKPPKSKKVISLPDKAKRKKRAS
jgi:integrase